MTSPPPPASSIWQAMGADNELRHMALLVIVDREGSAPNDPGAKMLVFEDGSSMGTVGGGASEAKLTHRALSKLRDKAPPSAEIIRLYHDGRGGPEGSGMICSGSQTYVLCLPAAADREAALRVLDCEQEGREGTLRLTRRGMEFQATASQTETLQWEADHDNWCYTENLGIRDHAILIGGGHVARALSEVLAPLGFRVTVLDNRKDLPTMTGNHFATETRVVDYHTLADEIPAGPRQYICIMTYAYRSDLLALRQLVGRDGPYLGLLGSRAKIDRIFSKLKDEGVSPEKLASIHAPIGLPIGSSTPEEIAISIAAELISVRRSPGQN